MIKAVVDANLFVSAFSRGGFVPASGRDVPHRNIESTPFFSSKDKLCPSTRSSITLVYPAVENCYN